MCWREIDRHSFDKLRQNGFLVNFFADWRAYSKPIDVRSGYPVIDHKRTCDYNQNRITVSKWHSHYDTM